MGPRVTSGRDSRQTYQTPRVFLDAVEKRFGAINFDLASNGTNAVVDTCFIEGVNDAFKHEWSKLGGGLLYLNPPFADIKPWAMKCFREAIDGARIVMLTPAGMPLWFRRYVAGVADVYELSGRICFDGKHPFPKDCRLSHFHPAATGKVCIWDWRADRIVREWRIIDELPDETEGA